MTSEEIIKALLHKNLQLHQQKKQLIQEHAKRMRNMRQVLLDQYVLKIRSLRERLG